jgi:hypothetical protein
MIGRSGAVHPTSVEPIIRKKIEHIQSRGRNAISEPKGKRTSLNAKSFLDFVGWDQALRSPTIFEKDMAGLRKAWSYPTQTDTSKRTMYQGRFAV